MCRLSWNLGASTSWNPQGLSRLVMGLLYLYIYSITLASFVSKLQQDFNPYVPGFLCFFFVLSSHYRANLVLWQDAMIFSLFLLLVFGPSFMFNDTFSINVFVLEWEVLGNAFIKPPHYVFVLRQPQVCSVCAFVLRQPQVCSVCAFVASRFTFRVRETVLRTWFK